MGACASKTTEVLVRLLVSSKTTSKTTSDLTTYLILRYLLPTLGTYLTV